MCRSFHPYEPFMPSGAVKLIIGSIPPQRFCMADIPLQKGDVDFYYGSHKNQFWQLMARSFPDAPSLSYDNTPRAVTQRKALLRQYKIGITDIIASCIHQNGSASDSHLTAIQYKNLPKLLTQYPTIQTLLFTSLFVKKHVLRSCNAAYIAIDTPKRHGQLLIADAAYDAYTLYAPSGQALRSLSRDGRNGKILRLEQYRYILNL